MPNLLHLIADDADELLNTGAYAVGAVMRVQSSATQGGAYADISGTGSTPTIPLVATTRSYSGYDPNGIVSTWYRTRYENAGGTRTSDWSPSFQSAVPPLLCTDGQVKARLNPAAVSDVLDDPLINELITQVSDWVHHFTGRMLVPVSSTTYVVDTRAGYVLRFPIGVRSVSALGVNISAHQPDSGGTYTTVPATDILLRPSAADTPTGWPATEIRLSRAGTTVRAFADIENGASVTGTFGFAATPPDIQAVVIDAVVAAYQNRKMGASGVVGADGDAIVPWVSFFSSGSPQRATLERYRYIGLG